MEALKKLTKARAGLILDAPFFGSLALRLILKADPGAETAWTDGVNIGYNPDFIDGLTLEQTKGLLAHEVMHVAAAHHCRRQGRNKGRWNIAGDHSINHLLSKFVLPEGALPGRDAATESIYKTIPEDQEDGADPGGSGEIRDLPRKDGREASPAERKQAEAEIKISVAQAAQQAKSAGKLDGALKQFVNDILEPVIDWRELLRAFVDTNAKNDYSWTPPNKRYIQAGLFLPGLRSNELGNIACLVDMSGSVSKDQAGDLAAELMGISEAYQSNINVIYFNHEVTGRDFYAPGDEIKISVDSGGGTDYKPVFDALEDLDGIIPAVVICLTDGCCYSFPDLDPGIPVIWAITGGGVTVFKPPFGEVIDIN